MMGVRCFHCREELENGEAYIEKGRVYHLECHTQRWYDKLRAKHQRKGPCPLLVRGHRYMIHHTPSGSHWVGVASYGEGYHHVTHPWFMRSPHGGGTGFDEQGEAITPEWEILEDLSLAEGPHD